jgi:hypothetical protein
MEEYILTLLDTQDRKMIARGIFTLAEMVVSALGLYAWYGRHEEFLNLYNAWITI